MGVSRRVIQKTNETCWAACMECWTHEAWYYLSKITFQERLAREYGEPPEGGLNAEGGKIQAFTDEFWLGRLTIPGGQLTKDRVERWLENADYFMLVFQTDTATRRASHAILVYNFFDNILFGMNPDPGTAFPYKVRLTALPKVLAFYIDHKKTPSD